MDDLISKLSEIRSEYNCFNQDEEPYYRALSEVISILSRRTDGDTIGRQVASGCEYWDSESNFCSLYRPSAERHGRWEFNIDDEGWSWDYPYMCDQCGEWVEKVFKFCPSCGAKMNEVEE